MTSIHHDEASIHNPVGELAAEHPGVVKIGRAGWFAKGVVYVIAGFLALSVAAKASGWADESSATGDQEASPIGAIKTVAGSSGGTLLLWLLAIGMLLYAAWRVVSALLPGSTDAKGWAHRIGYIASAVMYTTLAISAIALARHSSESPDGNKKVTDISSSIMTNGLGRIVVGLVGVIVICVGLYRISKGVKLDVEDELDLSGASSTWHHVIEKLGAVGEVGRGIGFALVGFFLLRAAVTYDANTATGLDGALRRLSTESTWGVLVVVLVGIGFAAYGVFCLLTFTRRRLQSP
jgi:hypothetical protein